MRISEGGSHQAQYGKGKSVPAVFPGQQEERGWVAGWMEWVGEWRLAGKGVRFCRTLRPLQELVLLTQLHPSLSYTVNFIFPSSRNYPLLMSRRKITVVQCHGSQREFQKGVNCVSCHWNDFDKQSTMGVDENRVEEKAIWISNNDVIGDLQGTSFDEAVGRRLSASAIEETCGGGNGCIASSGPVTFVPHGC